MKIRIIKTWTGLSDPDPTVEVEEEEIFIPDEEQEKYRTFGNGTSRKGWDTSLYEQCRYTSIAYCYFL